LSLLSSPALRHSLSGLDGDEPTVFRTTSEVKRHEFLGVGGVPIAIDLQFAAIQGAILKTATSGDPIQSIGPGGVIAADSKSVAVKLGRSLKGGFSAKFDSRTIEALDALGGDLIWQLNNDRAKINAREKALREAEAEIIAAAAKAAASYLKKEPKLALALLKGGISDFVDQQIGQTTVAEYTVEAIAAPPPFTRTGERRSRRS
jgi:hypothetical protein